jgi:isoleucyl-tRNA synthetase
VAPWAGVHVFDANPDVIRVLKDAGHVVRHETYDHPYPHCWRCSRPLVYRAVSSWFVQVTKFRDRMVELNQQIRWVPEHIRDGSFGKWLEHARDWSISRNRFWGSPIPVWRSDDPRYPRVDVYGSLAELERDFGVTVTDLHRPAVDDLVRPNPDDPTGASMMRRVPEVLDCWFESGSMPFAQVHYPFENADWFEHHYPGDFIVECIVLGTDGQKASKSLRNYVDPLEMFDTYGADAVRWFLLSSAILRGADLIVNEQGIRDAANQVLRPLWNAWSFFTLYANAEDYTARFRADQAGVLDRYLLAKLHDVVATVTTQMDAYDLFGTCASVRSFLDALTNWYIRRSRDRFWAGDADAFDTLYTTLHVLTRMAAPLLPLVTEEIYRGLTGERSVHLTDWPDAAALPADSALVAAMDRVRDVCSAALSIRKARGLRVRLPLRQLNVTAPGAEAMVEFGDIIQDEVNVKAVGFTENVGADATYELKLIPAALGPRLGADMQRVMRAYKSGDYEVRAGDLPVVGGVQLLDGEAEVRLAATDPDRSATLPGGGIVHLDTDVTPALEAEGRARDLVRTVQQARRDAGLHVSDRIRLTVRAPAPTVAELEPFRGFVADEVLATEAALVAADGLAAGEVEVEVERA